MTHGKNPFRRIAGALALLAFLAGCATPPDRIGPSHVSGSRYNGYTCEQLDVEQDEVNSRLAQVSAKQQTQASSDVALTTVGLVLFWPALLVVPFGDHKEEVARLKGESAAIEAVRRQKCAYAVKEDAPTDER